MNLLTNFQEKRLCIKAVNRSNWGPKRWTKICSDHFVGERHREEPLVFHYCDIIQQLLRTVAQVRCSPFPASFLEVGLFLRIVNRDSFCLIVKWGVGNQKTIPFLFLWFQFWFHILENVPKIAKESELWFFRNWNWPTSNPAQGSPPASSKFTKFPAAL